MCDPLLFVDPDTRNAVANQAGLESKLIPMDGVFAGKAPDKCESKTHFSLFLRT